MLTKLTTRLRNSSNTSTTFTETIELGIGNSPKVLVREDEAQGVRFATDAERDLVSKIMPQDVSLLRRALATHHDHGLALPRLKIKLTGEGVETIDDGFRCNSGPRNSMSRCRRHKQNNRVIHERRITKFRGLLPGARKKQERPLPGPIDLRDEPLRFEACPNFPKLPGHA